MAASARLLQPFLLPFTTFLALFPFSSSISESQALLKFKQSLTDTNSLTSWVPDTQPCEEGSRWKGLICHKGAVFGLQLEYMHLSGTIDVSALTGVPSLRALSIKNNSFTGTIPEVNQLGGLRSLYLSGNRFSGDIPPDYFSKMAHLKKLWLSNNFFTGPIPSSLAKLPQLVELHLENNQFSDVIPDFTQPTLIHVNFSNNRLEGDIPLGLAKFDKRSFAQNPSLCGENMGQACEQPAALPPSEQMIHKGNDGDNKKMHVGAAATLAVLCLFVVFFFVCTYRTKNQERDHRDEASESEETTASEVQISLRVRQESERLSSSRKSVSKSSRSRRGVEGDLVVVNTEKGVFGLPDLMKAAAEMLKSRSFNGNGGTGSAYKATMAKGVAVVVKRMTVMNQVEREFFGSEIRRFGSLRHENVLAPLAYHFKKNEKLLVHEFVPKGSLLNLLHGDHPDSEDELDWPTRLKIIQGIARGMAYLHTELASLDIPHGNLKSSNIFLKPDNEPLLSEFGFHPFINTDCLSQSLVAYNAPEANAPNGVVSPKCDVFCLGVVILEILTGKFPSQYAGPGKVGGTDIVEWVATAVENGEGMDYVDPVIAGTPNSSGEIEKMLQIAVTCTTSNPDKRPDMAEAVKSIEDVRLVDNSSTKQVLQSSSNGSDGITSAVT